MTLLEVGLRNPLGLLWMDLSPNSLYHLTSIIPHVMVWWTTEGFGVLNSAVIQTQWQQSLKSLGISAFFPAHGCPSE